MEQIGESVLQSLQLALEESRLQDWEEFVHSSHGFLASTIFRTLSRWGNPRKEEIEDLVQETFLKLFANDCDLLRKFRSDSPAALMAYLRAIASALAVDAQRSRLAQKRGSGNDPATIDAVYPATATTMSVEQIEREMLLRQIARCLSDRTERDRQVFWLYYRQGLTSQAIASLKIVELSTSGVESLIHRLTAAVRKCLKISASGEILPTAKGNFA